MLLRASLPFIALLLSFFAASSAAQALQQSLLLQTTDVPQRHYLGLAEVCPGIVATVTLHRVHAAFPDGACVNVTAFAQSSCASVDVGLRCPFPLDCALLEDGRALNASAAAALRTQCEVLFWPVNYDNAVAAFALQVATLFVVWMCCSAVINH